MTRDDSTPFLCAVIVPVYNGRETILGCLAALAGQTIPADRYEVIVVDDGSSDDTAAQVETWIDDHPHLSARLLRQQQAGPATARNQGAWTARAGVFLFTDADCAPVEEWIATLIAPFQKDASLAAAMGSYRSQQHEPAARFAQHEFDERYRMMEKQGVIDLAATYSAAYRKAQFVQTGGFDPTFPEANNEDVELSYRLSQDGARMIFVPEAAVYHRHIPSWWGYFRTKLRRAYWRTQVYRRYPIKAVRDSYTPQTLKLQIVLAPLVPLALVGFVLTGAWNWLLWGLPFLLTALPMTAYAAKREPDMLLYAPWGLWVRSIAFSVGVLWGLLSRRRNADRVPVEDRDKATAQQTIYE